MQNAHLVPLAFDGAEKLPLGPRPAVSLHPTAAELHAFVAWRVGTLPSRTLESRRHRWVRARRANSACYALGWMCRGCMCSRESGSGLLLRCAAGPVEPHAADRNMMDANIASAFAELTLLDPGVFGPLLWCWPPSRHPLRREPPSLVDGAASTGLMVIALTAGGCSSSPPSATSRCASRPRRSRRSGGRWWRLASAETRASSSSIVST